MIKNLFYQVYLLGSILKYTDKKLKQDRSYMLLIIKKFPNKLLQMPKQYLEDKEFVLTALHIYDRGIFNPQNKYIYAEIVFRLLGEKLRNDKDI